MKKSFLSLFLILCALMFGGCTMTEQQPLVSSESSLEVTSSQEESVLEESSLLSEESTTLPEDIKEGAAVPTGKLIGYVGETAMIEMADEPHLHFEMTVGGLAQDPLDYFEEQAVATLAQDNNYED